MSRHIARRKIVCGIGALFALSTAPRLAAERAYAGEVPLTGTAAGASIDGNVGKRIGALRDRFPLDSKEGLTALHDLSLAVLRDGLKESDPYERCYAASALAAQGDWSGSQVLEVGVASPDPGLRRAAIEGLGEIGRGQALRMLRRIYGESDTFGQLLVLQGLRGGGSTEALDLLTEAVRNTDGSLRLQAVENLGLLGDRRAIPAVRGLLAREDVRMFERVTAAHALLRLGDRSGVPLLVAAIGGAPTGGSRPAATLALGYAKEERYVTLLTRLLDDAEIDVTMAAAAALSRYGKKDGLTRLRRALDDPDGFTRRHAAILLEHVDYGVAHEVILAGFDAEDVDVRIAAVHAVGVAGGADDVRALTRLMHAESDPLVRADVAWALGHISNQTVIDPLVELVQDQEPAVRYTAADGLARTTNRLNGKAGDGRRIEGLIAVPARQTGNPAKRRIS
jgi:HEAT repeat protein